MKLARTSGYRRSAVRRPCGVTQHAALQNKSVVCSGSRVTNSTVMKLHGSDNRGGITVKHIQRALAHIYIYIHTHTLLKYASQFRHRLKIQLLRHTHTSTALSRLHTHITTPPQPNPHPPTHIYTHNQYTCMHSTY